MAVIGKRVDTELYPNFPPKIASEFYTALVCNIVANRGSVYNEVV